MNIDLNHLHHWMCAIRSSPDPMRTLDAFWKGQIDSKKWLIEKVRPYIFRDFGVRNTSIDIHGGWVGVLASMIFQSDIPVSKIKNIDIDPVCEEIAKQMNLIEFNQSRFESITSDMCSFDSTADIIINTSCEHISQQQYESWVSRLPKYSLIVLQSNNYQISEHIRIASSEKEFIEQSNLELYYSCTLQLPLYQRYMLIGKVKT